MNNIINKFLLVGDKFMPEIHLKQPGFTYSACGPFTKKKEFQMFMQTGNTDFIYKNELNKAVFNMIRLMVNKKIQLQELNQVKC